MKNSEWVKKTEDFLKEKFDSSTYFAKDRASKEYRLEHTYRVANIGREIARREGFDEAETVIACLLHDVSYCEEFGEDGWVNHGRRAAKIARPFLEELGMAKERIDDICYGIAVHVDDRSDFPGERTAFAMTVSDADNIDRFDAYQIHETLCYHGFLDKSFDEKIEYAKGRLAYLRDMMELTLRTVAADEMWKDRLSLNIAFFERLVEQLEYSQSII